MSNETMPHSKHFDTEGEGEDIGSLSDNATYSPPRKRKSQSREFNLKGPRPNKPTVGTHYISYEVGCYSAGTYVRPLPAEPGRSKRVSLSGDALVAAQVAAQVAAEEEAARKYKDQFAPPPPPPAHRAEHTIEVDDPEHHHSAPSTTGGSGSGWLSGLSSWGRQSSSHDPDASRAEARLKSEITELKESKSELKQELRGLRKQNDDLKHRLLKAEPSKKELAEYKYHYSQACKDVKNKDRQIADLNTLRVKDQKIYAHTITQLEAELREMNSKIQAREMEVSHLQAREFSSNRRDDDVVLTDDAKLAIEDVFVTKLNAWSREYFRVNKKNMPELLRALDEMQAPSAGVAGSVSPSNNAGGDAEDDGVMVEVPGTGEPMEGVEAQNTTTIASGSDNCNNPKEHHPPQKERVSAGLEPFLTALANISWDVRGLLESKGAFFASLVQAVAAHILAREVLAKPFAGYEFAPEIESIWRSRLRVNRLAGNRFRSDMMKNLLATSKRGLNGEPSDEETRQRDLYLENIVLEIDKIVSPVARLSAAFKEESTEARQRELFQIAIACDLLTKDWNKRLFDVTIINKEWLEKNRGSPEGAKLFEVGAEPKLESARAGDDGVDDTTAGNSKSRTRKFRMIMGLVGLGFVKTGTDDGCNFGKEEVWAKGKVILSEQCLEQEAQLPGSFHPRSAVSGDSAFVI